MEVVVFATINLTQTGRQNLLAFETEIERYPEVVECYTMTGIWDYILKIVTRDIRHYEDFVRNTLTATDMIRELHSHMAVTEIKNSTALPLDTQMV
jgi:Lrp/AsnC family transcriptional regulator